MTIIVTLKSDSTINVSGLLIRDGDFPAGNLKEALAYVQECIEKEEKRNLTSRQSRAADVCVYCGQPIGFKTKTCASGGACTAASLTRR